MGLLTSAGRISNVKLDWTSLDPLFLKGKWQKNFPLDVAKAAVGTFDDKSIATEEFYLLHHTEDMVVQFVRPMPGVPGFKSTFSGTKEILESLNTGFWSNFEMGCEGVCAKAIADGGKNKLWRLNDDGTVSGTFCTMAHSLVDTSNYMLEDWVNTYFFDPVDGRISRASKPHMMTSLPLFQNGASKSRFEMSSAPSTFQCWLQSMP